MSDFDPLDNDHSDILASHGYEDIRIATGRRTPVANLQYVAFGTLPPQNQSGFSAATFLLEPPRMSQTYARIVFNVALEQQSACRPQGRRGIAHAHCTLCTLFMLVGLILAPRPATAGNITYTWVEDDKQTVTASFVVKGTAQAAGSIKFSDVVSYSFSNPKLTLTFTTKDLSDFDFPMSISKTDAGPTNTGASILNSDNVDNVQLLQDFDSRWSMKEGERWRSPSGGEGFGHWTISGASTPEPSSLLFSGDCGGRRRALRLAPPPSARRLRFPLSTASPT